MHAPAIAGILIVAFGLTVPGHAREALSLDVSPAVAFEPATLTIRTTIEADPQNRTLEIVAESLQFYRSSEVPLDGDRAPRTTQIEFRSLPAGSYYVTATLVDASGEPRATETLAINVMARLDR